MNILQDGLVTLNGALSTAIPVQYNIVVTAIDGGNPPLEDSAEFCIIVLPSNHPPKITPQNTIYIRDDRLPGVITQVIANDPDTGLNGKIEFCITGGNIKETYSIDKVCNCGTMHEKYCG